MRTIPTDLPCVHCGYNLRTLPLDHRCPECGRPVLETLRKPGLLSLDNPAHVELLAFLAGYAPDAIRFVRDATHLALRRSTNLFKAKPISARDLCTAVREHALARFNDADHARKCLDAWGLRRSEDIGRILFTLADPGWLENPRDTDLADFRNLFTLDNLFVIRDS